MQARYLLFSASIGINAGGGAALVTPHVESAAEYQDKYTPGRHRPDVPFQSPQKTPAHLVPFATFRDASAKTAYMHQNRRWRTARSTNHPANKRRIRLHIPAGAGHCSNSAVSKRNGRKYPRKNHE